LIKEDPFWPTGLRKSVCILAWNQVFADGRRLTSGCRQLALRGHLRWCSRHDGARNTRTTRSKLPSGTAPLHGVRPGDIMSLRGYPRLPREAAAERSRPHSQLRETGRHAADRPNHYSLAAQHDIAHSARTFPNHVFYRCAVTSPAGPTAYGAQEFTRDQQSTVDAAAARTAHRVCDPHR
jgi:hypothetical protein